MIDSVGDGSRGADDAELADSLRAERVDVWIVLCDEGNLNVAHVGVGGDVVLGEVVVHVVAEARVQDAFFV